MIESVYRLFGKVLVVIGTLIFFFPVIILLDWFGGNPGRYIPQFFDFVILTGLAILGISIAYSGLIIQKRYHEMKSFLTKDGGPIHSVKIWKKESESGLFLTSCGLVLSINKTSRGTSHVGYRSVAAKHATCSDCNLREGGAIMETVKHGRIW